MSGLEITLAAIGSVVAYMIMAILFARFLHWAGFYEENEDTCALIWPVTLPLVVLALLFVSLEEIVKRGSGYYD